MIVCASLRPWGGPDCYESGVALPAPPPQSIGCWYNPEGQEISIAAHDGLSVVVLRCHDAFLQHDRDVTGTTDMFPLLFAGARQQHGLSFAGAEMPSRLVWGAEGGARLRSALAEEIRRVAVCAALRDKELLYEMQVRVAADPPR